jgi:hypothetical protein
MQKHFFRGIKQQEILFMIVLEIHIQYMAVFEFRSITGQLDTQRSPAPLPAG